MSNSDSPKTGLCIPTSITSTKFFRVFWDKGGDRCVWSRSRLSFQSTLKKMIPFTPIDQTSSFCKIWSTTISFAANIGKKRSKVTGIRSSISKRVSLINSIFRTKVLWRLRIWLGSSTCKKGPFTEIETFIWSTSVYWSTKKQAEEIYRFRYLIQFFRRIESMIIFDLSVRNSYILILYHYYRADCNNFNILHTWPK